MRYTNSSLVQNIGQSKVNMRNLTYGTVFGKICARMAHSALCAHVPTVAFDQFDDWTRNGFPAVLSHEETVSHDVLGILEEEFGSQTVKVRSGDYGAPDRYVSNRTETRMTVSDLLSSISSPDHPYMANQPSSFKLLRTLTGTVLDRLGGEAIFECPTVWLGAKGAVTPLHKDSTDNFAFHFMGRKTWILFPPTDAALLNLQNVHDRPDSEFCVSSIDLRQHAALDELIDEGARPIRRQITAGECLYIPAGWSHFVQTEELTLMVNVWQIASRPARVLE